MQDTSPSFLRRNYALISIEGGMFMGGMAFLSMESVMPAMIHEFGGPAWLESLVPVLWIIGFCWPQVFGAVVVERLHRMKPMVLGVGLVQRLPYLLTGCFLLIDNGQHMGLTILLAASTPFIMSSMGGFQGSAYFELLTRIVPVQRTASMWAIRNVMMGCSGILAGFVIRGLLVNHPGVQAYGILHLITFFMMIFSLIMIIGIRETNIPEKDEPNPAAFRSGFAAFGQEWRNNPSLGRFVVTRMLFLLVFVAVPFLSIRAIERTGQGAGILGMLVLTQMIGFIIGNVFSGYLGDRHGVRPGMLAGRVLLLAGLLLVPVASLSWQFMAIYFCLGFGLSTAQVGDLTMVIDFAPHQRRKFFFAVMSLLVVPGLLAATAISSLLQYVEHGFYIACAVSITGVALSMKFLLRLDDPRKRLLN